MRAGRATGLWVCALAVTFAFAGRVAADTPRVEEWNPGHTWVFAMGLVTWSNQDLATFAAENRSDVQLMAALQRWGVPAGQITYLQDEDATKARSERSLQDLLAKTRDGDSLIFFFAGHGGRDAKTGATSILPYDSGVGGVTPWLTSDLVGTIDRSFRGKRVLFLSDSCHSGGFADAVRAYRGRLELLAVNSVNASDTSTSGWTYTDALIAVFDGDPAADRDRDGWIALNEMARFVRRELAFGDSQFADFTERAQPLRIVKVTRPYFPEMGLHVWAKDEGTWYPGRIVDSRPGEYKIHWYSDWETQVDSWMHAQDVERYQPLLIPVGTRVEVRVTGDEWIPGTVLRSRFGLFLVHVDGFAGQPQGHWFDDSRIRFPRAQAQGAPRTMPTAD